jgi:hypothetical protein
MASGYIYIMFMPELPHCLKVGQTTRDPEVRAKELSGTSSPLPFRVLMQWHVTNVDAAEKAAHESLAAQRVASDREFFRVSCPQAIERIGKAVRPFLWSHLDKALLDDIASACNSVSDKYFRYDRRSKPQIQIDTNIFSNLSEQLHKRVLWDATQLIEESNDPRVILSILNIVDLYFEGPFCEENSPEALLSHFFHDVELITFMMKRHVYWVIGSNYVAPSVLDIITNLSRTITNVMIEENNDRAD